MRIHGLLALCLFAVSCGTSSSKWDEVQENAFTPAQEGQAAQAKAARGALFESLMARLTKALAEEGMGPAIEVCQVAAPQMAEAASEGHDVRIGRTSFKLRNPRNAPPDWAAPFVEAQREEAVFLASPDGRLAALFPIMLKADCVLCHGPQEMIPEPIQRELAEHYPRDEAVGFREGSLRGYFHVVVEAR